MLGLRSQIIQSDDIQAVASWYETALQTAPYFQNENYLMYEDLSSVFLRGVQSISRAEII